MDEWGPNIPTEANFSIFAWSNIEEFNEYRDRIMAANAFKGDPILWLDNALQVIGLYKFESSKYFLRNKWRALVKAKDIAVSGYYTKYALTCNDVWS